MPEIHKRERQDASAAGRPTERQLACWIEAAARHQMRAAGWLRFVGNPAKGPVSRAQRRTLVGYALEHVLTARVLLLRAREASPEPAIQHLLQHHLLRLDILAEAAERQYEPPGTGTLVACRLEPTPCDDG